MRSHEKFWCEITSLGKKNLTWVYLANPNVQLSIKKSGQNIFLLSKMIRNYSGKNQRTPANHIYAFQGQERKWLLESFWWFHYPKSANKRPSYENKEVFQHKMKKKFFYKNIFENNFLFCSHFVQHCFSVGVLSIFGISKLL